MMDAKLSAGVCLRPEGRLVADPVGENSPLDGFPSATSDVLLAVFLCGVCVGTGGFSDRLTGLAWGNGESAGKYATTS